MTPLLSKLSLVYIRNNMQSCVCTIVFTLFFAACFILRFYDYYIVTSFQLALARACGLVLNLQSALILLLILRKSISYLRSIGFAHYLPLDHYVYFHKIIGYSIFVLSVTHTVAHLYNFWTLTDLTTISYAQFLFSCRLGIGWIFGFASASGWILLVALSVMLVLSLKYIRRSGKFEVFYYSHKLYIAYYIFLVVHSPAFWKYFIVPFFLFCFEWLSRQIKTKKNKHGLTYAIEGTLLPSRVIRLVICKPRYFAFNPGDFVYVKIPLITDYEWHPITISSAPEDENITIHVRCVGEWTNRLYDHFDHAKTLSIKDKLNKWKSDNVYQPTSETEAGLFKLDPNLYKTASSILSNRVILLPIPDDCDEDGCGKSKHKSPDQNLQINNQEIATPPPIINMPDLTNNTVEMSVLNSKPDIILDGDSAEMVQSNDSFIHQVSRGQESNAIFLNQALKISLDGPYGAPSSNIFETEHAVLIATGIGVTPFASILQSIMHRYIEKKRKCHNCGHSWTEKVPSNRIMNLKKVDFVWINRDQISFEWFVEVLSNLKKQQFAVPTYDDEQQRFLDIHMYVTGSDERLTNNTILDKDVLNCQFGRPNWKQLFAQFRDEGRGRVSVFFCGRPDLASVLRTECNHFNFSFKKEVF